MDPTVVLRRLASSHPSVLQAVQQLYQTAPAIADQITMALCEFAHAADTKTQLALRMLNTDPRGMPSMRYMPDVALDYICTIGGVTGRTLATVEFRERMRTECDSRLPFHPAYRGDVNIQFHHEIRGDVDAGFK